MALQRVKYAASRSPRAQRGQGLVARLASVRKEALLACALMRFACRAASDLIFLEDALDAIGDAVLPRRQPQTERALELGTIEL